MMITGFWDLPPEKKWHEEIPTRTLTYHVLSSSELHISDYSAHTLEGVMHWTVWKNLKICIDRWLVHMQVSIEITLIQWFRPSITYRKQFVWFYNVLYKQSNLAYRKILKCDPVIRHKSEALARRTDHILSDTRQRTPDAFLDQLASKTASTRYTHCTSSKDSAPSSSRDTKWLFSWTDCVPDLLIH